MERRRGRGGDGSECEHVEHTRGKHGNGGIGSTLNCVKPGYTPEYHQEDRCKTQYHHTCAKCGARRVDAQIGLEKTPEEFVATMVEVFGLVREVLADDGTLWLNLGNSFASDIKGSGGKGGFVYSAKGNGGNAQVFKPRRLEHGLKPKDLCGMPWRVAFALQADGWYLRSDIIWHKPNAMPESVTDRPTKSHEYLFLLTKNPRYYYDAAAVREESSSYGRQNSFRSERKSALGKEWQSPPGDRYDVSGRNRRDVWTIASEAFADAHFATFPKKLVEPCILAGTSEKGHCPECGARWMRVTDVSYEHISNSAPRQHSSYVAKTSGQVANKRVETLGWRPTCTHNRTVPDVVLDPFLGSGTVAEVAQHLGRGWIGIDLNPTYMPMQQSRTAQTALALAS